MTFRDPIRFLRQCQLAACVAAAVVGPLAGCQMRPVPLSAQAGSTIALPLDWLRTPAAHGGTEYDDPQRGELVFALGEPVEQGGLELTTRVTLALEPPPLAVLGREGVGQYLALVDLVNPQGSPLPLGAQTLHVSLRRGGSVTAVDQQWPLAVLPAIVDAGGEAVTGAPTPSQVWGWWLAIQGQPADWTFLPRLVADAIPPPSIHVTFFKPGTPFPPPVWAAEFEVSFPDDVAQVVDVASGAANRAVAWSQDLGVDAEGRRTLAVGAAGSQGPVQSVAVAFSLKGSEVLEPADVEVVLRKAAKETGELLAGMQAVAAIR